MLLDKKLVILYEYNQNGPGKVIKNLKLGLDKLGVVYVENPSDIYLEDKVIALQYHPLLEKANPNNLLIGPNVCTLPIDNQFIMSQNYKKCIVPSPLVGDKYSQWISREKLFVWPVGIDTDFFSDKSKEEKQFDCLIYFKRRDINDLKLITNMLKERKQTFNIISYGDYNENDFIRLISKSKYGIIVDNTESQGIAIQEMMSCNIPLFVWDVTMWVDRGMEYACPATSIPYWDERCGVFEINRDNIEKAFDIFLEKFGFFHPRDYILENLTLEICAKKIIDAINS